MTRKFTTVTGVAAPLLLDDVNTDLIIPIEHCVSTPRHQFGRIAFEAIRYRSDGSENPDFILNRTPYRGTPILVAGTNFGCGSSREPAVVALDLGIDRYFAEVLPETKDRQVARLQAEGKRVVMVGDGVNDAPALTRADVGVAIGSGTDVAVESAGIVLVRSNPLDVVKLIRLSRASYRKMIQNLWWAAGYNIVAIPLAAGVLAPWGILLHPALGAVLMSLSTVIVAINAQLLRRAV